MLGTLDLILSIMYNNQWVTWSSWKLCESDLEDGKSWSKETSYEAVAVIQFGTDDALDWDQSREKERSGEIDFGDKARW